MPGQMVFNTAGATQFPGATKPLPLPLHAVKGISGQFNFNEFPSAPNGDTTYEMLLTNEDLSEALIVALFGDGSLIVQLGPTDPDPAPIFAGAWTPNNGSHVVYFTVSAEGIPTLTLDGVHIPLTPAGSAVSFASLLPANVVSLFLASAAAGNVSAEVSRAFVTVGTYEPGTEFCCPR